MPGELSTLGAQLVLKHIIGATPTFTVSRSTYFALLTSAPNDNSTIGTLAEVNTTGYARQPVTWGNPTSSAPVAVSNTAAVTFGPFTNPMALPATHGALVSAATGTSGDFLFWWQLEFSIQAGQNESVQFAIGALELDLT